MTTKITATFTDGDESTVRTLTLPHDVSDRVGELIGYGLLAELQWECTAFDVEVHRDGGDIRSCEWTVEQLTARIEDLESAYAETLDRCGDWMIRARESLAQVDKLRALAETLRADALSSVDHDPAQSWRRAFTDLHNAITGERIEPEQRTTVSPLSRYLGCVRDLHSADDCVSVDLTDKMDELRALMSESDCDIAEWVEETLDDAVAAREGRVAFAPEVTTASSDTKRIRVDEWSELSELSTVEVKQSSAVAEAVGSAPYLRPCTSAAPLLGAHSATSRSTRALAGFTSPRS